MRYCDEAIRLRSEYIQKPLAATDVNQATLCVTNSHPSRRKPNGMRHSTVAKVKAASFADAET